MTTETKPAGFDIHLSQSAVECLAAYSERSPGDTEWPELRLQLGEGHSGRGLYLSLSEYPEEGAELLAEIPDADAQAALERDAARYRWLRGRNSQLYSDPHGIFTAARVKNSDGSFSHNDLLADAELDGAIDAARAGISSRGAGGST